MAGGATQQPKSTAAQSDARNPVVNPTASQAATHWNYSNGAAMYISMDHFMNSGPGKQIPLQINAVPTVMGLTTQTPCGGRAAGAAARWAVCGSGAGGGGADRRAPGYRFAYL
jgi:hypothetical protein